MSEHFEAVEADLLAHYGVDIRQGIGVRRLRALLQGLPPGGAVHRAVDPTGWRWSPDTELLATLAQVVDLGNRLYYAANTRRGTPPLRPLEIRRPDKLIASAPSAARRRQSTTAELKRFVGDRVKVVTD